MLPEATRLDRLQRLVALEPAPDALRRLAALIEVDPAGAIALAGRLRFSNEQRDRLGGLAPPWDVDPGADDRAQRLALYYLFGDRYRDQALLLAAEGTISKGRLRKLLDVATWRPPRFPLKGRDVTNLGIPPGKRVGELLAAVREWWEAGDFTADRAACLQRLKEII
jgi:poly(A) polymerase